MKRMALLGGGLASLACVACIEEGSPAPETPDAAVDAAPDGRPPAPRPDAAPAPESARDAEAPPDAAPASDLDPDPEPEPEPEPDPEPDPEPEPPPPPTGLECPPEGRAWSVMGARVLGPLGEMEVPETRLTIVEVGVGPWPDVRDGDGVPDWTERLQIGAWGSHSWFSALDVDRQLWTVILATPVDVDWAIDDVVTITGEVTGVFGNGGHLIIEDVDGLRVLVAASDIGFGRWGQPDGLDLSFGDLACEWAEPDPNFCSYRGHALRVRVDGEEAMLPHGTVAEVGAFDVVHAGLMEVIDGGACNAGPTRFNIGVIRR